MIFTRLLDARRYYVGWLKHTYAANDDITRWLSEIYRDTEISWGIIAVRAYSKWPVVYDRGDAIRTFSFVRRERMVSRGLKNERLISINDRFPTREREKVATARLIPECIKGAECVQ